MQLRVLCIALVAVAVGLFAYRWQSLDYPVLPDQDSSVWQIEAQIDLEGRGDGARVGVFVPPEDGRFGPIEEDFVADGLALTTVTDAIGNRSAVWSSGTLEGRSSVVYRPPRPTGCPRTSGWPSRSAGPTPGRQRRCWQRSPTTRRTAPRWWACCSSAWARPMPIRMRRR
ncbi:MAG: hypothetical protein GVY28_02565 [Alphaproteobacteria bacterium]|jgi:hypothetical protein|nr:hypothetical protein [Alphaproteobacteria bacterium]